MTLGRGYAQAARCAGFLSDPPPRPEKFWPGGSRPHAPLRAGFFPHGDFGALLLNTALRVPKACDPSWGIDVGAAGRSGAKHENEEVTVVGGKRMPTDLVKKHLTKAEEADRRASEVSLPPAKTARPPKWLPEYLKKDFRALGKKLIAAGIYTDLDSDTLGRYLVAHHQWTAATDEVQKYLDERNAEEANAWGRIQERYFKQARNCANDMGLTVTSRCRLVVPPSNKQSGEENNPFLRLIQGGAEKRA